MKRAFAKGGDTQIKIHHANSPDKSGQLFHSAEGNPAFF